MQGVGVLRNPPVLLRVLTDLDLFSSALAFLTPVCLVRLGCTCGELDRIVKSEEVLGRLGEAASCSRWREPALMPKAGERWSLERLHLCFQPPEFPLIHFDFAHDGLDSKARQHLDGVAATLRRHMGLSLLIRGYARPEAPPDLGLALSQARATRVRSYLVGILGWDEDANDGIRAGGYSEMHPDIGEVLEFYSPRVVGRQIKAVGCWSEADMAPRLAYLGSCGGQSAEIVIHSFQDRVS